MIKSIEYDDELLGFEYHQVQLLKLFERFCLDMNNSEFNSKVREFYRNTTDPPNTTRALFSSRYDTELDDEDSTQITEWISAHLKKKPFRKQLSEESKKELWQSQKGKCNICGCALGEDYSEIHVDHIIPWVLVGDELSNNYQYLCKTCNTRKNKQIDYYYKKIVGLV